MSLAIETLVLCCNIDSVNNLVTDAKLNCI